MLEDMHEVVEDKRERYCSGRRGGGEEVTWVRRETVVINMDCETLLGYRSHG